MTLKFPPRRIGGVAANSPRGKVLNRVVYLGLHQPRCRSLVHPRLFAATASRFIVT